MSQVPTLFWTAAFVLGLTAAGAVSIRLGWGRINPVTVYGAIWGSVVALLSLQLVGFDAMSGATWVVVSGSAAAFVVGCGAGAAFATASSRQPSAVGSPTRRTYDERRLALAYKLGLAAFGVYLLIQVVQSLPLLDSAGGIKGLLTGGGLAFRRAQLEAASLHSATSFDSGSALLGIIGYFLFTGALTIFWAGHYARQNRWGLALIPLLMLAMYSLFALERSDFIYGVVLFAFSYMYHGRFVEKGATQMPSGRLAFLAILTAAVVLIPIALRQPERASETPLAGPVQYYLGGLAGLDTRLTQDLPAPEPRPATGVWTFYGVASLLERSGLDLGAPPTSALPYVSIGADEQVHDNVYTYLIYPLLDFGYLGMVLYAFVFGGLCALAHTAVRFGRRLDLVPVASLLMASVTMSFFGISLLRDARWLFVVAVAFLIRDAVFDRPAHPVTAAPVASRQLAAR